MMAGGKAGKKRRKRMRNRKRPLKRRKPGRNPMCSVPNCGKVGTYALPMQARPEFWIACDDHRDPIVSAVEKHGVPVNVIPLSALKDLQGGNKPKLIARSVDEEGKVTVRETMIRDQS